MTGEKPEESPSILVVDDDETIRRVLEGYLKANGYAVYLAENGKKAIRVARENLPDLVLLDVIMEGMDGFEVCTHLKEDLLTRDIPVLFITTLSDAEIHKKAIEHGGQGFITKPFSEDLLIAYARTF
jgi:CheY-like chemotaxis protein